MLLSVPFFFSESKTVSDLYYQIEDSKFYILHNFTTVSIPSSDQNPVTMLDES